MTERLVTRKGSTQDALNEFGERLKRLDARLDKLENRLNTTQEPPNVQDRSMLELAIDLSNIVYRETRDLEFEEQVFVLETLITNLKHSIERAHIDNRKIANDWSRE